MTFWRSMSFAMLVTALAACGDDTTPVGDDGGMDSSIDPDGGVDASADGSRDSSADAHTDGSTDSSVLHAEWNWVGSEQAPTFATTRCMDKTATGIGVNRVGSTKLLIYLQEGGACFESITCPRVGRTHFDSTSFTQWAGAQGDQGVFAREASSNPFNDWDHVFVPYCSGDVFAGNNPDVVDPADPTGPHVAHVGYVNFGVFLDWIVANFPGVQEVALAGSSAGGFGVLYNYDRVHQAFGVNKRVTLFDDSAAPMNDTYLKPCLQKTWRDRWNLDATLPADCTACKSQSDGGGLVNLVPFIAKKYPNDRMAYISAQGDLVIRAFYGFGYSGFTSSVCGSVNIMPEATFQAGTADFKANVVDKSGDALSNARVYYISGTDHIWLYDTSPLTTTTVSNVALSVWLSNALTPGSNWSHVVP